jgi:hypothetical protein
VYWLVLLLQVGQLITFWHLSKVQTLEPESGYDLNAVKGQSLFVALAQPISESLADVTAKLKPEKMHPALPWLKRHSCLAAGMPLYSTR